MSRPVEITTPGGLSLVYEQARALPLTDFVLVWRSGAVADGEHAGATRLLARLLRRGPRGLTPARVDETLSSLGARLSIVTARESVRVYGSVLARNTGAFLSLLGRLLCEPALRAKDLARERRRILGELSEEREDDGTLAERHHRAHMFGTHAYGRPIGGHEKSVRGVRRETLQTLHARHYRKGNLFFGISSPHPSAELVAQLDDAFAGAPSGKRALPRLQSLRHRPGRRVRIVQRSGRNQCQLAVGTLGAAKGDPARTALIVGDYAFGGLFSSPLVQEVRGVRGWSYSAQSVLRLGQARESWTLWTHPQADRAAACAALELELMERLVACGPSAEDLQLAKRYLIGSRALDIDTAARRTELALEARYEGKPLDWPHGYEGRIRGVKRKAIQEAFERCIDPAAARITAVGDGKLLAQAFEKLPGVTHVEVVQP